MTPPSLVPQEYGNRVKTDRRDSRKLARRLAKGLLKRVWVPSEEERHHRQVVRRRRQLIGDRVRTQNRIKSELSLYGYEVTPSKGPWSKLYFENLCRVRFRSRWMQESFTRLLEQYAFLSKLIEKQTELLKELAHTEKYREHVEILRSVPGIGVIAAMEILVELQASVVGYAVAIHFLYPRLGILAGTIGAFLIALVITMVLFILRKKIR